MTVQQLDDLAKRNKTSSTSTDTSSSPLPPKSHDRGGWIKYCFGDAINGNITDDAQPPRASILAQLSNVREGEPQASIFVSSVSVY